MAIGTRPKTTRNARLLAWLAKHPGRGNQLLAARKYGISPQRVSAIVLRERARQLANQARLL